jgi:hypothetical protein
MVVGVPGTRLVRFAARPVDSFRVVLCGWDGYLTEAGLGAEDLVVSVAGQEIVSEAQGWKLLREASGRDTTTIGVQRGGSVFEIRAKLGNPHDRHAAGGYLVPWAR